MDRMHAGVDPPAGMRRAVHSKTGGGHVSSEQYSAPHRLETHEGRPLLHLHLGIVYKPSVPRLFFSFSLVLACFVSSDTSDLPFEEEQTKDTRETHERPSLEEGQTKETREMERAKTHAVMMNDPI